MAITDGWYQSVKLGDGAWVKGEMDCVPRWKAMTLLHDLAKQDVVLDVGASEGFYTLECADHGAAVDAVEMDLLKSERLAYVLSSRKPAGFVSLYTRDVHEFLMTKKGIYDAALSLSVIHHLPGPLYHIWQVHHALKVGGVFYLEVPYAPGAAIRFRKREAYVLGDLLVKRVLERMFTSVRVALNWTNTVKNHRILWEAVK